jgi:prepilin-type N-terminal cleavage/methylation domain-containing protein
MESPEARGRMPTSAVPTDRRGFSLLEVLIALALLGVVIGFASVILRGSFRVAQLQSLDPVRLLERENLIADQWAGLLAEKVLQEQIPENTVPVTP